MDGAVEGGGGGVEGVGRMGGDGSGLMDRVVLEVLEMVVGLIEQLWSPGSKYVCYRSCL